MGQRIASDTAKFGYFYTRRGLLGSSRALTVLVHTIGISRTMEMMLSGELIDAQESLEMGLVRKVVPGDQLMDEAKAFARKLIDSSGLDLSSVPVDGYVRREITKEEVEYRIELGKTRFQLDMSIDRERAARGR